MNFNNMICRLCLQESNGSVSIFTNIFNEGRNGFFAHKIMQIANVQIFEGDGLPTLVCRPCLNRVESIFQFKIQIEKSDFYLRQQLCSFQTITLTPIVEGKSENLKNEPVLVLKNAAYLPEGIWSENISTQFSSDPNCEDLSNTASLPPQELATALTQEPQTTVFVSLGNEEDKSLLDLTQHEGKGNNHSDESQTEVQKTNNNDSGIDTGRNFQEEASIALDKGEVSYYDENQFFNHAQTLTSGNLDTNKARHFYSLNVIKESGPENSVLGVSTVIEEECRKDGSINECEDEGIDEEEDESKNEEELKNESSSKRTRVLKITYCEECDTHFKEPISLKKHQASHLKESYKCTFCDKTFKHSWYLQSHIRTHTGERPFPCTICSKAFTDRSALNAHMRIAHFTEKSHICSHCDKGFKLKKQLDRHLRIHTGHHYHRCEICGKLFTQKSNLMKHLVLHSGEKPYLCSICKKPFAQKDNLNIHILRHHSQQTPVICDLCGKPFKNKVTLMGHKKSKHTESTKQIICEVCGKIFPDRSCLNSHRWVHSAGSPVSCDICGKNYPHIRAMRVHKRTVHSEVRKYCCDVCGVSFKTSQTLRHHAVVHTGERAFSCEECGRSFGQKTALKTHQRIHSGVEPYSCPRCGESFKWKQTRDKHVLKCDGKICQDFLLVSESNSQTLS